MMKSNIKLTEEDIEAIRMTIKNALKNVIIDIDLRDGKEPWGLIKGGSPDKFADLKEAYERGEDIEYFKSHLNMGAWMATKTPAWSESTEYRIRPLQIGDWVSNGSDEVIKIVDLWDTRNVSRKDGWKRITDKELINKLNNL